MPKDSPENDSSDAHDDILGSAFADPPDLEEAEGADSEKSEEGKRGKEASSPDQSGNKEQSKHPDAQTSKHSDTQTPGYSHTQTFEHSDASETEEIEEGNLNIEDREFDKFTEMFIDGEIGVPMDNPNDTPARLNLHVTEECNKALRRVKMNLKEAYGGNPTLSLIGEIGIRLLLADVKSQGSESYLAEWVKKNLS